MPGVLGSHRQQVLSSPESAFVRELERPSSREGVVEEPGVLADQADVELLGIELSDEPVQGEREAASECLVGVEGRLMKIWLEEITGSKVLFPIDLQDTKGQRTGLPDIVVPVLVGKGDVGATLAVPKLAEDVREAAVGFIAEAIFHELATGKVVIDRPFGPAEMDPVFLAAEAAARDLWDDLSLRAATLGDDVERAGQGVPAKYGYRPPDQLDPLDIVEGEKVEVDLLDGRLVHPDAIDKDADPLGDPGHRRRGETAK